MNLGQQNSIVYMGQRARNLVPQFSIRPSASNGILNNIANSRINEYIRQNYYYYYYEFWAGIFELFPNFRDFGVSSNQITTQWRQALTKVWLGVYNKSYILLCDNMIQSFLVKPSSFTYPLSSNNHKLLWNFGNDGKFLFQKSLESFSQTHLIETK